MAPIPTRSPARRRRGHRMDSSGSWTVPHTWHLTVQPGGNSGGSKASSPMSFTGSGMSGSSLAQVEHALGLAHAALDGLGCYHADLRRDADDLVDLAPRERAQGREGVPAGLGDAGAGLDPHLERVER